jgi:hypothetical protein
MDYWLVVSGYYIDERIKLAVEGFSIINQQQLNPVEKLVCFWKDISPHALISFLLTRKTTPSIV